MNRAPLVFLKLGGALLTHKDQSASPRSAELRRLVGEIAPAWRERSIRLVLGHGSGSFAHVAAQRSGFLERPDDPLAFAQVAAAARDLSALVVRALLDEDLPALMLPGGLLAAGEDGAAVDLRTELVAGALARGLLPVTYGDAAPRRGLGGGSARAAEPGPVVAARSFDHVGHQGGQGGCPGGPHRPEPRPGG